MIEGNASTGGVLGGAGMASTQTWIGPKPWAEISADEKIERLKDIIEDWRRVCDDLRSRLALFEQHQHGPEGRVLVDLQQADRTMNMNRCANQYNMLR